MIKKGQLIHLVNISICKDGIAGVHQIFTKDLGFESNFLIIRSFLEGFASSSSTSTTLKEKKATSAPDTKAEQNSKTNKKATKKQTLTNIFFNIKKQLTGPI
mgnify:CR=1 FL=1